VKEGLRKDDLLLKSIPFKFLQSFGDLAEYHRHTATVQDADQIAFQNTSVINSLMTVRIVWRPTFTS